MIAKLEALIESYSTSSLIDFLYYKNLEINEQRLPQYDCEKFTDGLALGEIDLPGQERVGVFTFQATSELSERSSRKAQYDKAKKILKDLNHAAGLFVFYDRIGAFRFSLVYPQYLGTRRVYTNFKRFTFFVSNDLSNKTFKQFVGNAEFKSLDSIKESFSVSRVTKEFFDSYKRLFVKVVEHIQQDEHFPGFADTHGIHIEDVAKKLLGQIVFLYFLQRKGWLGAPQGEPITRGNPKFLRELFRNAQKELAESNKSEANFFNDYLEYLFYDSLNTVPRRSASFFRDRFQCQIPFLNGGLFEPVANYKWRERFLKIPDEMFSNSAGDGILDVFDSYNFTIDESSADDQEVSVDPEMLGKVFENLLEENLRKGTGSFYTPRDVVQYMVRESLRNYLRDCVVADGKTLDALIDGEELATEMQEGVAKATSQALRRIKIVDPACGSGAFLVAMLQEIARMRRECEQTYSGNPRTVYRIKKAIIQESIYGVDIDSGAVDIARLRIWLSLVVDHETRIEDIEPLPNLDYKLMQGNSLLDHIYVGGAQIRLDLSESRSPIGTAVQGRSTKAKKRSAHQNSLEMFVSDGQAIANSLIEYHNQFYSEAEPSKKGRLKEKIESLENDLIIAGHNDAIDRLAAQIRNTHDLKGKEKETLSDQLAAVRTSLENWQRKNIRPFFPWRLHFSEVFDQGGFDIVIANPPYLKERDNKDVFERINNSEFGRKYHQGKMDYWYYFLHKAIDLVKEEGVISYITSRYWLNSQGAKKLIRRVKNELSFLSFIDIGKLKVFDDVAGHHMVAIYRKSDARGDFVYKKLINSLDGISSQSDSDDVTIEVLSNKELYSDKDEIILSKELFSLDSTVQLGAITDISQGVVQNPDKVSSKAATKYGIEKGQGVFVLTKEEYASLKLSKKEKAFIKPFYDEKDISKYYFNASANRVLIYLTKENCDDIDKYPNLKKHLLRFKKIMDNRRETKKGTIAWFQMHWPRKEKYFERDKIVFPSMFKSPTAVYTEGSAYFGMGSSMIISKDEKYDLKYILAILNSKLAVDWFFRKGKRRGAGVDIGVEKLRSFPIKIPSDDEQHELVELVDSLMEITSRANYDPTKPSRQQMKLENMCDQMVNKLYRLTGEDIETLEAAQWT